MLLQAKKIFLSLATIVCTTKDVGKVNARVEPDNGDDDGDAGSGGVGHSRLSAIVLHI